MIKMVSVSLLQFFISSKYSVLLINEYFWKCCSVSYEHKCREIYQKYCKRQVVANCNQPGCSFKGVVQELWLSSQKHSATPVHSFLFLLPCLEDWTSTTKHRGAEDMCTWLYVTLTNFVLSGEWGAGQPQHVISGVSKPGQAVVFWWHISFKLTICISLQYCSLLVCWLFIEPKMIKCNYPNNF